MGYSPIDSSAMISKPGQKNLSGDEYAMMIKKFNGEVTYTFHANAVTDGQFDWTPLVGTDTLSNAAMGDPELVSLEPGQSPPAKKIEVGDQHVQVRKAIITRVAIGLMDDIQDRLNVRGRVPGRMGEILAKTTDKVLLLKGIHAARQTTPHSNMTGWKAGYDKTLAAVGDELDGAKLEVAARAMAVQKQEDELEMMNGRLYMSPTTQNYLFDAEKLTNSFYSAGSDVATMALRSVADLSIISTARLAAQAKTTSDAGSIPALFGADYAITDEDIKTIMLYLERDALMIAQALPVRSDIWWDDHSKTYVLDTYTAFGAGVNDPRFAGCIRKKTA